MEQHLCPECGRVAKFYVETDKHGVRHLICCNCGCDFNEPGKQRKERERREKAGDKWRGA